MLRKLISAATALLFVCFALWLALTLGKSGKFGDFTDKLLNDGFKEKTGVAVGVYEIKSEDAPSFENLLGQGEEDTVKNWFIRYNCALGELSDDAADFSKLYHDYSPDLSGDVLVLKKLVEARKKCSLPLTFPSCDLGLRLISAVYADAGMVEIRVEERFSAVFDGFPDYTSAYEGTEHLFALEKDGEKWYVRRHETNSAYAGYILSEKSADEPPADEPVPAVTAEFPYAREKAVEYARTYAKRRNAAYEDYPDNSANFVSQCLKEGDIPFDSLWNKKTEAFHDGDAFYEYIANEKASLAAGVCAYEKGEAGDVIQFTDLGGRVLYSALIVGKIGGENGEEYLIAANSSDTLNFPAAALGFDNLRIIKIYGYN